VSGDRAGRSSGNQRRDLRVFWPRCFHCRRIRRDDEVAREPDGADRRLDLVALGGREDQRKLFATAQYQAAAAAPLGRDLEAARYAADRAFRQYDAADPTNRLVAGELEARWNRALSQVADAEAKIVAHEAARLMPCANAASLTTLAMDLKSVWTAPTTDARVASPGPGPLARVVAWPFPPPQVAAGGVGLAGYSLKPAPPQRSAWVRA